MKTLDDHQAQLLAELANDFGITHANAIQFRQNCERLTAENQQLQFALEETQKKLDIVTADNAKLADQLRGKAIPTLADTRRNRAAKASAQ